VRPKKKQKNKKTSDLGPSCERDGPNGGHIAVKGAEDAEAHGAA
jgi:hypothetical protein